MNKPGAAAVSLGELDQWQFACDIRELGVKREQLRHLFWRHRGTLKLTTEAREASVRLSSICSGCIEVPK